MTRTPAAVQVTTMTLLLSGSIAGCGPMLIPEDAEPDEEGTVDTGEDVEVDDARRGVTETRCSPMGRRLDLEHPSEDMRLLAAGLESSGARVLVRRGLTTPVLFELDVHTGDTNVVATLTPGRGTDLQFSKAAFDQDGPRLAMCDHRDEQHGLRVVDENGVDSWRPFSGPVPECTQVSASDDAWLVLAKEWATDAPGTLLRLAQDDDGEESRLDLDMSMRSPTSGIEPLLFSTGNGELAFLYRPYEHEMWSREALRVLRLDRDFTVAGEPIELVELGLQNGAVARAAVGDQLAVVFEPRADAPSATRGPHLLTLNAEGELGMPTPLSIPSEHAGRSTLHANGEDLFWAWVDLPDFDPATATSSSHRIVLQPIDLSGAPTGPLVVVANTGSTNAINLSLHSRRVENRVELLLAWQTAGMEVEHTTVHAVVLTCQ